MHFCAQSARPHCSYRATCMWGVEVMSGSTSSARAEAASSSEEPHANSDASLKEYALDAQIDGLRAHACDGSFV